MRGARRAAMPSSAGARRSCLGNTWVGSPKPTSVRWVTNQGSRWGSCTPVDGTIRLSDRLATMPGWVVDYVLVHELAHLIEIGHGPRFYRLVDAYPKAERARGYLLGVVAGAGWATRARGALDQESAYEAGQDDEADGVEDARRGSTRSTTGRRRRDTETRADDIETELDALW